MARPIYVVGTGHKIIHLTVNGEPVSAREGSSVYDVVVESGVTIPSMCYHYTFKPFGSCGVCLVHVEGKKALVRSCTAPILEGMVVRTGGQDIFDAQKKAVERHLSVHPLDCPVCDADGFCELQDIAYEFGVSNLENVKQKGIPEDTRSTVLDFNMNRCILCGECINICKEVMMVDALQFMKKDGNTHVVAKGDKALHCEFCGDCLAVCPVGAITNKFSKYAYKPWQLKTTTTTCPYCGDGCTLLLDTNGDQLVRVRSLLTWKTKWGDRDQTVHGHGGICGRGRFGFQWINSPDRLDEPLFKRNGEWVENPWVVAASEVANRLTEIKAQHGGQAIAGIITARCTNEEMYLFQKFMRTVLGTNHIDSSARYGHINFALAMQKALGVGRGMAFNADLTLADVILIIGSDMTETNPVAALRPKEAMRNYKGQVIVVHPVQNPMAKLATHHLALRPGSERMLIQGMIRVIIEQDLVDPEFAAQHSEVLARIREAVLSVSLEAVQEATGLEPARIEEMAQLFAKAPRGVIVLGEGIVRQPGGYDQVLRLIDLAMLAGKLDKPGCGLTAMCEENNEQGAVEWGVVPEFLPGQIPFEEVSAREKMASAWGQPLPDWKGDTLLKILERARRGEIRALYLVGENPLGTLPESAGVREALQSVSASGGLVICQDLFRNETTELADVILPACSFAEKEGTFTNFEGKINPVERALECRGESRADWEIFSEISREMGFPLDYERAGEIRQEMSKLLPGFMSDRHEHFKPLWKDYLSNGFVLGVAQRYASPATGPAADAPGSYCLVMGQNLYHSGKLTTRDSGLMKIYDRCLLQINLADAERLGVSEGDQVRIRSSQGVVEVGVSCHPELPEGLCFFPEHFNDPPVKDLMVCDPDPVTAVPYHKTGRVTIEKISGSS